MNPARIVVVEDHRLFRTLLAKMLAAMPGVVLAGEAGDAAAGLRLCEEARPDLVLLDLQMPGGGGLKLAAELRAERPTIKLLALTSLTDSVTVERVSALGFDGYVEKDAPAEQLEEAIAAVAAGRRWFSPFYMAARRRAAADPEDWRKILSDREQEVLSLVGQCLTSAEIAEKLGLSQRTVETHRYNMMRKLGIEDAPSLIRYALEKGFARPTDAP